MALTIDFRSETWRAIEEIVTKRIDDLRKRNDSQLNADETARLRGRLAELKDLLTLAKPDPALVADEQ